MSAAPKYQSNVRSIKEARVSRLLSNEHPLLLLPELAKAIGLNEAVVLQQIHYWLTKNGAHTREDANGTERRWIYNTLEGWAEQFPFWSPATVRRTLEKLRTEIPASEKEAGRPALLVAERLGHAQTDQTLWYSIDYKALGSLDSRFVQNEQMGLQDEQMRDAQDEQIHLCKMSKSYKDTETTTETTAEREARTPANPTGEETTPVIPREEKTSLENDCAAGPSLDAVKQTAAMTGVREEVATAFFLHYEAQGWTVGGSGAHIANWKAKLAQWNQRQKGFDAKEQRQDRRRDSGRGQDSMSYEAAREELIRKGDFK